MARKKSHHRPNLDTKLTEVLTFLLLLSMSILARKYHIELPPMNI